LQIFPEASSLREEYRRGHRIELRNPRVEQEPVDKAIVCSFRYTSAAIKASFSPFNKLPSNSHADDFGRWGRRGGLATLRRYGTAWFSLLARRRWERITAEALAEVFAAMNGGRS
jgi:hypothetical protein